MSETIAVLIVFFFLLVFGMGFYTRVQKVNIERDLEKNADLRAIAIAQKASFLPELQCTFGNIQKDNCFDELKINAFKKSMLNPVTKDYYTQTFGFSNLTLTRLALEGSPRAEIELYANPKPDSRLQSTINVPVNIKNPITGRFSFGLLLVRTYG